jgi:hypothetical protein
MGVSPWAVANPKAAELRDLAYYTNIFAAFFTFGEAVQLEPMEIHLNPPGTKRLKLNCDDPLSIFAFNFNLRRYTSAF